ncbi:MAG: sulfatase [Myxococcota bacterium]|nr:sulfatase [Myxococcota bacterium]
MVSVSALVCSWMVLLGSANAAPPEAKPEKEVIFLILVDALRPDHMGIYGYDKPTTPEMDKLGAAATRYTRAYVNAPWTRPSTASFLTGLNASRHKTETAKTKLPKSVTTLAERLGKAGWTTAGFVANGNGGSLGRLHKGFDVFRDPTNTYTKKKRGKTYNNLPTGEFLVSRTLEWMDQDDSDKLFVFMFLVDPHDPYAAPKRLEKQFLGDYKGKLRRMPLWEYNNDYPEDERQAIVALYNAGIRYSDEALGRLFGELKKRGLYDNAHIFLTSDHGEGFGEHGFYLHAHHFWDEVIKIPLLAHGPKFKAGQVDTRLTQSIDITKTIAELAGARSEDLPGRSLLKSSSDSDYVISEYNEFGIHRQAIIGKRYKVIWQRPASEKWFMKAVKKRKYFPSVSFGKEKIHVFDLENDPGETKNLAAEMPAEAAKLLQTLRDFVAQSRS